MALLFIVRTTATSKSSSPDFRKLRGKRDLHRFLGCTEEIATGLLRESKLNLFEVHQIPKRNGGKREVWEVKEPYTDAYRTLSRLLQAFFLAEIPGYPHMGSHGYLQGRSILTNAKAHVGATRLLRADIKSFFRSITHERVREFFLTLGLPSDAADTLVSVVVRDDHLPLGLHTSPAIANAICHELDQRLAGLVAGGVYTRYADDLTFSGSTLPTIEMVKTVVVECGFELASDKCGILLAGRGLYVTGLSIEDGKTPRVPKAMKHRIRQELYYAKHLGLEAHVGRRYASLESGINHIHGTIQFIRGIERTLGDSMQAVWCRVLRNAGAKASYRSVAPRTDWNVTFVLDESHVTLPSGKMMLLALVAIEDPELVGQQLADFLADRVAEPYPSTSDSKLTEKGLHWNDLSPDDRTRITDLIRHLPFRAFIAYAKFSGEDRKSYTPVYKKLLGRLIAKRLVRYDGANIRVFAEQNSRVPQATIENVVSSAYSKLEISCSRRPKESPHCRVIGKLDEPTLPLADLLLGIFGDYAQSGIQQKSTSNQKNRSGAQAAERFAKVQDKIRAVFDMETGITYSRRRIFEPWSDG